MSDSIFDCVANARKTIEDMLEQTKEYAYGADVATDVVAAHKLAMKARESAGVVVGAWRLPKEVQKHINKTGDQSIDDDMKELEDLVLDAVSFARQADDAAIRLNKLFDAVRRSK